MEKQNLGLVARAHLLVSMLVLSMLSEAHTPRRLRTSRRGMVSVEGVGFGLAIVGGILALYTVFVLIVAPSFEPLIDSEIIAILGLIAFGAGIVVWFVGED